MIFKQKLQEKIQKSKPLKFLEKLLHVEPLSPKKNSPNYTNFYRLDLLNATPIPNSMATDGIISLDENK